MKALLLENIHDEAVRTLREAGYEVERVSGALGEDELIEALDGVDLLRHLLGEPQPQVHGAARAGAAVVVLAG